MSRVGLDTGLDGVRKPGVRGSLRVVFGGVRTLGGFPIAPRDRRRVPSLDMRRSSMTRACVTGCVGPDVRRTFGAFAISEDPVRTCPQGGARAGRVSVFAVVPWLRRGRFRWWRFRSWRATGGPCVKRSGRRPLNFFVCDKLRWTQGAGCSWSTTAESGSWCCHRS